MSGKKFVKVSRPNPSFNQRQKSSGISKKYEVIDCYKNYAKKPTEYHSLPSVLDEVLEKRNYKDKFHALLYLSEAFYRNEAFKRLKICNVASKQFEKQDNNNFIVRLEDQFGKNSYMKAGDSIHVKGPSLNNTVYEGYICKIDYKNKLIDVSLNRSFQDYLKDDREFKITFKGEYYN